MSLMIGSGLRVSDVGLSRAKGLKLINPADGIIDALAAALSPNGEDYAFYDFTDISRIFTLPTGSVESGNAGGVIGLGIGKEKSNLPLPGLISSGVNLLGPGYILTQGGAGIITESPSGDLSLIGDGTNFVSADKQFNTIAGKQYAIRFAATSALNLQIGQTQGATGQLSVTTSASAVHTYIFTAVAAVQWVRFRKSAATLCNISGIQLVELPAHYATQATATWKPTLQTAGAKFDGSDDSLLTDWFAQAGENCIIAQVDVPAVVSALHIIAGSVEALATRFYLSISGGSGIASGGLGGRTNAAIFGGPDLRGTSAIIGLSSVGSTDRLFVNDAEVYTQPSTGAPNTTRPVAIGSYNNAGAMSNPFGGSVKRLALGKKDLTLAQFQAIRAQWLAAP